MNQHDMRCASPSVLAGRRVGMNSPARRQSDPWIDIIGACHDPNLFGRWFRDEATWRAWFAFLAALFGLPMTKEQRKVYRTCTGRDRPPRHAFTEGWLVCGRRAGKSFILALIAAFLACFRSYADYLGPGERATILVLATDRKQARVIMRYVKGLITGTPLLAAMLEGEPRAEGLDLSNGVTIEVATASYRATRGYTIVAALCDELAFWPTDDLAEPDYEILDAIRPGTATIPNAMLLCASQPIRTAWRSLGCLQAVVWSERSKRIGLEGTNETHESECPTSHHRPCIRT